MEYLQLACPYCAGQFSAAAAVESRTTACPHCDREVTVPAASPPSPPSPPPPLPPTPPPPPSTVAASLATRSPRDPTEPAKIIRNRRGDPVPHRLSPEERAKMRRRFNAVVAILGMTILAIALMVLLRIRP